MNQLKSVDEIREFNRFYTNVLGLLDEYILASDYSFTETRIMFEINCHSNCTAKEISARLNLDPGYLSRTIQRLIKENICEKIPSIEDKRSSILLLSEKGKIVLTRLAGEANKQIALFLDDMTDEQKTQWLDGTRSIRKAFGVIPDERADIITIRYDLRPGDIGEMIRLHALIYGEECGYNHTFEGYVCKTFYEFLKGEGVEKSRIWFAESKGEIIGTIAIVRHDKDIGQLRWFLLKPEFRGKGIGKNLLDLAFKYASDNGIKQLFLMTSSDQKKAISMYEKMGFCKTESTKEFLWGKELFTLRYDMFL